MSRTEFSAKVRKAAWERCQGRCEKCAAKLFPGQFDYDHIRPDGLEGEPTLENCQVLCKSCHHQKTIRQDRPIMAKADRVRKKHLGITSAGRSFPSSRASPFKRKMDGTVVKR